MAEADNFGREIIQLAAAKNLPPADLVVALSAVLGAACVMAGDGSLDVVKATLDDVYDRAVKAPRSSGESTEIERLRAALRAADTYFRGVSPDRNAQTEAECEATVDHIAEMVAAALASEKRDIPE